MIGSFSNGECTVDNASNLVITHPDCLVPVTLVSDSFNCLRRSVLSQRFKPPMSDGTNLHLVYGSMSHELLQETLACNDFSSESMGLQIDDIILRFSSELHAIHADLTDAVDHLQQMIPLIQKWHSTFIGTIPQVSDPTQYHLNILVY